MAEKSEWEKLQQLDDCPFCGNHANYEEAYWKDECLYGVYVKCVVCGCRTKAYWTSDPNDTKPERKAQRDWNARI